MQIRFVSGTFENFVATRTFSLGGTNYKFTIGDEVQFDGAMAKVYNDTIALPQLKGAIRVGWFVPKETYVEDNPEYGRPVSANMHVQSPVRSGNSISSTDKSRPYIIEGDERVVATVSNHAAHVRRRNTEEEEVRRFKSPKHKPIEITPSNAGMLIREASRVTIDPGKGITEEELLARMTEDEQETYLEKKAIARSKYVQDAPPVKKARKVESEGVSLTTTVGGGGVTTVDLSSSNAKAEVTVTEVGGIKFTNTNCSKKEREIKNETLEDIGARRVVARTICPDFPDSYDFGQPAKKRIARLVADFENRPDILRAAYAAETDAVKQQLVTEFPEAFQQ